MMWITVRHLVSENKQFRKVFNLKKWWKFSEQKNVVKLESEKLGRNKSEKHLSFTFTFTFTSSFSDSVILHHTEFYPHDKEQENFLFIIVMSSFGLLSLSMVSCSNPCSMFVFHASVVATPSYSLIPLMVTNISRWEKLFRTDFLRLELTERTTTKKTSHNRNVMFWKRFGT